MTSAELSQRIRDLVAVFKTRTYLMEQLIALTAAADQAVTLASHTIAQDGNQAIHSNNNARQNVQKLVDQFRQIDPFQLAADLEAIENAIRSFHSSLGEQEPALLDGYLDQIKEFKARYKSFVVHHRLLEAVVMFNGAKSLYSAIRSDVGMLNLVERNLYSAPAAISEHPGRLTVTFSISLGITDIVVKLQSLNDLYTNLCILIGVNSENEPLEIIKLETGSLYIDVVGNKEAMAFLTALLAFSAMYIYRNYTVEGRKRTFVADRIRAIDIQNQLSVLLKKRGLDSEKVDDQIKESCEKFASQLNSFVGSDEMKLNGQDVASKSKQLNVSTPRELPQSTTPPPTE